MKLAYDVYLPSGDRERNLPPIIMMHGMLDSRKTWKNLAPRIASNTGRRVYAVDARNHGDSPWNETFSFDINAEDLIGFLSEHRIPKAVIVGHSMGGRTAIRIALRKPECVEKIVVEDMNLRNFAPNQSGLIVEVINMMKESLNGIPPGADLPTAKRAIAKFFMTLIPEESLPKNPESAFDMVPLLKKVGSSFQWKANLDVIQDMLTSDKIRQNLEGVFMGDALFLYGTKSFFRVEKDKLILKMFPYSSLMPIDGATHLVHFEFPDRFVDEVSSFVNSDYRLKAKY